MGDTTSSTLALLAEWTAPRPILCRATLRHDPNPEGVCRDCGIVVGPNDPVAGTCTLAELPGMRSTPVPATDRISFWRNRR